MKCASTNCPMDSGEYVLCEYHRSVASLGEKITVSGARLSGRGITKGEAMTKITYNTSPYTDDADLPHSPAAEPSGRKERVMSLPSIHPLSDKICINCGNSFVTGVLLSKTISPYCDNCSPQVTHHCPDCEAAARELADLKSDKAWADKLAAERGDELSNLRREHEGMTGVPVICGCGDHIGYAEEIGLSQDGAVCGNCAVGRADYDARTELATLRARLAAECDAVRAKAMDEDDDYYIIAERFRALLETEGK